MKRSEAVGRAVTGSWRGKQPLVSSPDNKRNRSPRERDGQAKSRAAFPRDYEIQIKAEN